MKVFFACALLLIAAYACANTFYFEMQAGVSPFSVCQDIGLEYVGEPVPGSDLFECTGNVTAEFVRFHQPRVMMDRTIKINRKPVTRMRGLNPNTAFSKLNHDDNLWPIPTIDGGAPSVKRAAYHNNAYGLVASGSNGANTTITIIDSCFYPSYDCTNQRSAENDVSGSNLVNSPLDGSDCVHGTEMWSILTGRDLCTRGIVPSVGINAREINIDNDMLTDKIFAKSLYSSTPAGAIYVWSFNAVNYGYDKSMVPIIAHRAIDQGAKRGSTYFVSAGNLGNLNNRTALTTCFDSLNAGMMNIFPIAANCPSGSCWYTQAGCVAFSAPGGDSSSCIAATDGTKCTCVAGTSFAAPYAAALASLLQQACQNTLSNMDIYDIMVRSSTNMYVSDHPGYYFLKNAGNVSYSHRYGHGILNYKAALADVAQRKCPHVPPTTSCTTERIVINATAQDIRFVNISAPSNCGIKTITFVKIYATFTYPLNRLSNFFISSPAERLPCVLLSKEHPYSQPSLDIETGCRAFYGEPYIANGTWRIHFANQFNAPSRSAFALEIFGYVG